MKRSTVPIQAERVFNLQKTGDGWKLRSTASPFVYNGPIASDPAPPWTADEWEAVTGMFAEYQREYVDDYGDRETETCSALNVPEWALLDMIRDVGPERLVLYHKNKTLHHGFHAFRPGEVLPEYGGFPVVGEVDLFGRVVEYERGYRAQGVRIRRLRLVGIPEDTTIAAFFHMSLFGGPAYLPQGDPGKAPEIVADLSATYDCEVLEEWQQHRLPKKENGARRLFLPHPLRDVDMADLGREVEVHEIDLDEADAPPHRRPADAPRRETERVSEPEKVPAQLHPSP